MMAFTLPASRSASIRWRMKLECEAGWEGLEGWLDMGKQVDLTEDSNLCRPNPGPRVTRHEATHTTLGNQNTMKNIIALAVALAFSGAALAQAPKAAEPTKATPAMPAKAADTKGADKKAAAAEKAAAKKAAAEKKAAEKKEMQAKAAADKKAKAEKAAADKKAKAETAAAAKAAPKK